MLPRVGTSTKSHNEMSDLLSLYTTNLGLSYNCYRFIIEKINTLILPCFFNFISNYDDVLQNQQNLVLNVACLDKNIPKMLEILAELITSR